MTVAIVLKNGYIHRVTCENCTAEWSTISGELINLQFEKSDPDNRLVYVNRKEIAIIHREG